MTTFPKEIHRGADGYSMMRLESHDLTPEQWCDWMQGRMCRFAESRGPRRGIMSLVARSSDGTVCFITDGVVHYSAAEALAYHEELAKPIVERIELMEFNEVSALAEGAL